MKNKKTEENIENKKLEKNSTGKTIFKIIGIIVLIIVVMLLAHTIKNYIKITMLQNNISKYSNSENYYVHVKTIENSGTKLDIKYYRKGNKQANFLEREYNGKIFKLNFYNNGERTDEFIDNENAKIARLNVEEFPPTNIYNYLETSSFVEKLVLSFISNIKLTNYNGKDCYIVKTSYSPLALNEKNPEYYIDKDTGLCVKLITKDTTSEREYEFDNVDDSIFTEPDISQYEIKYNN